MASGEELAAQCELERRQTEQLRASIVQWRGKSERLDEMRRTVEVNMGRLYESAKARVAALDAEIAEARKGPEKS